MLKKILLPLLIILGLTIFVCTIIALKRDEFNPSKNSENTPQNEIDYVPYEFKAENNDTKAIAREARNGNVGGSFVNKESVEDKNTPVDESGIFFNTYKFFAFIGYSVLGLLLIFFGRY